MGKSCENCLKGHWIVTNSDINNTNIETCAREIKGDYDCWIPDYETLQSQLSAANKENEVLKEVLEKIAKLDFDLPGTGEECVACVKIVSDYAMKILKESRSHPAPVDEEKEVLKNTVEQMAREFVGSGCCPLDFSDSKYGECSPLCREIWDEDTVMNCIIDYFTNQARSRIEWEEK